MNGLKRFLLPGVMVSAAGHIAALLLGLLFAGANPFGSVPPDAMTVDIVRPDEVPQPEGKPPVTASLGLEVPTDANASSAVAQPSEAPAPMPQPSQQPALSPQQSQQPQPRQSAPRNARQASALPQPTAQQPPQPTAQQPPQPQASEVPRPPTPQPAPGEPHPEAQPDQASPGGMFAMPLALPNGRLGGGFDAPAIDTAQIAHDDNAAFRAHVNSCSSLPSEIDPHEKIRIVLRVSLKPDGMLAAPPLLIEASASPKGPVLMQSAVTALQKCQPYTMLPRDKYKEWKTLDLSFTPLNFGSR